MYTVYSLEDPRYRQVFYVGITDDVYARFLQHLRCDGSNPMKDARIQELRQSDIMVVMPTLQQVQVLMEAKIREAYWIQHYLDLGHRLCNQHIPTPFHLQSRGAKVRMERAIVSEKLHSHAATLIEQSPDPTHGGLSPDLTIKMIQVLEMDEQQKGQNEIIKAVWQCEPNTRQGQSAAEELRLIRAYLSSQHRKTMNLG